MGRFLFFDEMLTPKIITLIYWLMIIGVVITSVAHMFGRGQDDGFLFGLLYLLVGVVGARIWCELMIVIFKIHENLRTLAERHQPEE